MLGKKIGSPNGLWDDISVPLRAQGWGRADNSGATANRLPSYSYRIYSTGQLRPHSFDDSFCADELSSLLKHRSPAAWRRNAFTAIGTPVPVLLRRCPEKPACCPRRWLYLSRRVVPDAGQGHSCSFIQEIMYQSLARENMSDSCPAQALDLTYLVYKQIKLLSQHQCV